MISFKYSSINEVKGIAYFDKYSSKKYILWNEQNISSLRQNKHSTSETRLSELFNETFIFQNFFFGKLLFFALKTRE